MLKFLYRHAGLNGKIALALLVGSIRLGGWWEPVRLAKLVKAKGKKNG